MSTGAERRSNEGGELVLGRPKENGEPVSLKFGWFSGAVKGLIVVDEFR